MKPILKFFAKIHIKNQKYTKKVLYVFILSIYIFKKQEKSCLFSLFAVFLRYKNIYAVQTCFLYGQSER